MAFLLVTSSHRWALLIVITGFYVLFAQRIWRHQTLMASQRTLQLVRGLWRPRLDPPLPVLGLTAPSPVVPLKAKWVLWQAFVDLWLVMILIFRASRSNVCYGSKTVVLFRWTVRWEWGSKYSLIVRPCLPDLDILLHFQWVISKPRSFSRSHMENALFFYWCWKYTRSFCLYSFKFFFRQGCMVIFGLTWRE